MTLRARGRGRSRLRRSLWRRWMWGRKDRSWHGRPALARDQNSLGFFSFFRSSQFQHGRDARVMLSKKTPPDPPEVFSLLLFRLNLNVSHRRVLQILEIGRAIRSEDREIGF